MTEPVDVRPVYSEVMEDHSVFGPALSLGDGEIAVSVSSAGDNVWNLALDGGRHVFGVDVNPLQTAFCRLKEAAIRALPWEDFAGLVGTAEMAPERRAELIDGLARDEALAIYRDPAAKDALASGGLAAAGHLAAFVAPLRAGLGGIVGPETLESILTAPDRAERERLWQERFENDHVAGFFAAALNEQTISGSFIPGWAFPQMAEKPFHSFYRRVLRDRLVELDPTGNPFLHRLWRGRFPSAEAVPPYLQRGSYERLRGRLDAITWHTADLLDFLRTLPPASVHVFNLSNVLDWSEDAHYAALWEEVDRTSAAGARAFLRSFLAERQPPETVAGSAGRWSLDAGRSPEMAAADRVGYYSRYELWTRSAPRA